MKKPEIDLIQGTVETSYNVNNPYQLILAAFHAMLNRWDKKIAKRQSAREESELLNQHINALEKLISNRPGLYRGDWQPKIAAAQLADEPLQELKKLFTLMELYSACYAVNGNKGKKLDILIAGKDLAEACQTLQDLQNELAKES